MHCWTVLVMSLLLSYQNKQSFVINPLMAIMYFLYYYFRLLKFEKYYLLILEENSIFNCEFITVRLVGLQILTNLLLRVWSSSKDLVCQFTLYWVRAWSLNISESFFSLRIVWNRPLCLRFPLVSCLGVMIIYLWKCGGVCNLVISVDCSLNYSHHKYNTKLYNRAKEME